MDSSRTDVTFLFTDLEGSTRLWESLPEIMPEIIARHDRVLKDLIENYRGRVFKTVGDACCAVFSRAEDAIMSALEMQHAIEAEDWGLVGKLHMRIALYTGSADERSGDYFGQSVNRVARLLSSTHGGQITLSDTTSQALRQTLPAQAKLLDLGQHRFKDLIRSEHVFQLLAPGLRSEFPRLNSLDAHRTNLPTQATPFVGRQQEVADLCELVIHSDARLITLTGPGGTGKTRLALQTAAELADQHKDGVYFVPLSTAKSVSDFITEVARTLGLREDTSGTLPDAIEGYLHERHLLLVLDNFEQVVEAGSALASILNECRKVNVIVTSRTPLQLYGEHEYEVRPLPAPGVNRQSSLDMLLTCDSVVLFLHRARSVKRDFVLNTDNAPTVAEICHRLDGLPLAIELAAAKIKLLPPKALLARLMSGPGAGLRLLTGGARDLPERQQTLRATIDWSYRLLNPSDQMLFSRLAVFSGGWTIDAAEYVCNVSGEADVFTALTSLVGNSLVRTVDDEGDEARFAMLETIREFSVELMVSSGNEGGLRKAHRDYFLRLVQDAPSNLSGSEQDHWLQLFDLEHDNIRTAIRYSLDQGDGEAAAQLALSASRFWKMRGHFHEGRRWLKQVLELPHLRGPLRGRLLYRSGSLAADQSDYTQARLLLTEAMEVARDAQDKETLADALNMLGATAVACGDDAQAESLFRESLTLTREIGDSWGSAACLINLGNISLAADRYEEAHLQFEESLALWKILDDKWGIAFCLGSLGTLAVYRRQFHEARGLLTESLQIRTTVGDKLGKALAMGMLGLNEGHLGDIPKAEELLLEALKLCKELGNTEHTLATLQYLATVHALDGDMSRAVTLWGAVDALGSSAGIATSYGGREQQQRHFAKARERIGEAIWAETWAKGASFGLEETIAFALKRVVLASA